MAALRDKAMTGVNNRVARRRRNKQMFNKCEVLTLQSVTVQFSLLIKSEHLIYKPDDAEWNSIAKLHDCFCHAHSLTGEAQHEMIFWIVKHASELRSS